MLSIRAGYFTVICNATAAEVEAACEKYVGAATGPVDIGEEGKKYRLKDVAWATDGKILIGTMWRIRTSNLPSVVNEKEEHAKVEGRLAEATSFAFMPSRSEALVQFNLHGPRHTQLIQFLAEMKMPGLSSVSPAVTQGAIERLKNALLVRRLEFSIADRDTSPLPVATDNPEVKAAIDTMRNFDGYSIHVEVSMGRKKGTLKGAKEAVDSLLGMVWGVQSVKASVKDHDEAAPTVLDMLSGRLVIDLNVDEAGNQIDHAKCRTRLLELLKGRVTTSEEPETEDDDDADPVDIPPSAALGMA